MAHMASATAAANFQEHSDDLRTKLVAAERQLRCAPMSSLRVLQIVFGCCAAGDFQERSDNNRVHGDRRAAAEVGALIVCQPTLDIMHAGCKALVKHGTTPGL